MTTSFFQLSQIYMGQQYRDTGWFGFLVTGLLVTYVLFNIKRAKGAKELFIRRISGLNAIDEAIGRATEMGKPVLMVPGLSTNINAIAVQAINICAYVAKIASRFSNPILLCAYNAPMYTLAQEVIRDTYQQEGVIDRYDPDSVRFISDRQFAFAAGVSGLILREQAAATFFLGEFYAESLIFAETANSIGAIQVASSTEATQTPFFIAACDYVLIGDEFYAASAYLTRQPVLVGSLVGQDWAKLMVITLIFLGTLSNSVERGQMVSHRKSGGKVEALTEPERAKPGDLFFNQLFSPDPSTPKIEREKDPEEGK